MSQATAAGFAPPVEPSRISERRWAVFATGGLAVASRWSRRIARTGLAGLLCGVLCGFGATAAKAQPPTPTICNGGDLPTQGLMGQQPDLVVTGKCTVQPDAANRKYFYANVNILDKGELTFAETTDSRTNLWASAIVIENGGAMTAGVTTPFGTNGGTLTIHIYGAASPSAVDLNGNPVPANKQGQGVLCRSLISGTTGPCGIPQAVWNDNGVTKFEGCVGSSTPDRCLPGLPVAVKDLFYQYGPLYGDAKMVASGPDQGKIGYFGYKTLAVSFGGRLVLRGYKGASYDTATDADPTNSGVSWIRLAANLEPGAPSLTLANNPGDNPKNRWKAGDQIVVTTTDYLPGHSEQLKIASSYTGGTTIPLDPATPVQWKHIGVRFPLMTRIAAAAGRMSLDPQLVKDGAETRAAVALLTRSIQIVSAGDGAAQEFTDMPATYSFGAQMIVRQGFQQVQIQGVEFKQMGQGGRLGHYPVHFHMARKTPQPVNGVGGTFVKDSSVNESMTRWYVIHSTQGVTLARDVGWKSIGHGYYLEDGTETDNNFYSDIGIFARAGIDNDQNNRKVPGILADNQDIGPAPPFNPPNVANPGFPYRSDNENPTVFWITNGWNNFIGNMAAGAGTCGACYWLVPAENSDMPDVPTGSAHMSWSGYAALQKNTAFAGATPLKSFYKNYCSSAMHSFQTTSDAPACSDVGIRPAEGPKPPGVNPILRGVPSIAPKPVRQTVTPPQPDPPFTAPDNSKDPYYPHVIGGARHATRCPLATLQITDEPPQYDCSEVQTPPAQNIVPCGVFSYGVPADDCAVTVLDHYTSAFNWANGNISAVWLRPQWYLLDNSVLSDVQNGALTFVTGGDYTQSSVIPGYWALARNTVFIGNTQTGNLYASNAGPFNKGSPLACDNGASPGGYCLNAKQGVSFPLVNFMVNQKMLNIYDGPNYQDSDIFLDITTTPCTGEQCIYGVSTQGIRKNGTSCYLPNAAIAWKQPNGFYYPPAFHSKNLFFDHVDIRHYVIAPLFKAPAGVTAAQNFGQGGTYLTDLNGITVGGVKTVQGVKDAYCGSLGATGVDDNSNFFSGFTGIDRQTELSDDDGSLTGLSNSLPTATPPNPLKQTISVNEDNFFTSPVETAECLSNTGILAKNACSAPKVTVPAATARTSPYDYVVTVVYHPANGGVWDSQCSNETCYGVPLYRQLLTGTKGSDAATSTGEWAQWFANGCDKDQTTVQCRWPFIRMAGANISQRNTMTVNNGTYYIDTTVPKGVQKDEDFNRNGAEAKVSLTNFFNVFTGKQTYYVFFLYAKQSTQQTYQIYVGNKGFNATTDLQAIHMKIPNENLTPDPIASRPAWLTAKPLGTDGPGILTVTINFNGRTELDPTPKNGLCEPHTFCKASGTSCGCALTATDPLVKADPGLLAECTKVCSTWAVKDLDCPAAGCLGFSVTLPDGFTPDATLLNPSPHRPVPTSFPTIADAKHLPDWTTKFLKTATDPDMTKGSCFYSKLPGTDCTVP